MAGGYLEQAAIYLGAAVCAVPIFSRLGLGSVLGYLAAGVVVGPSVLNLVGNTEQIMHVAEFGVVVMLFLVGLELQPKVLWRMKGPVFGLGGLQVLTACAAITGVAMLCGLAWPGALAIGMALALSSTAIVLQSLAERGQNHSEAGQKTFSILLFQDIAVIPMLALLPILGSMAVAGSGAEAAVAEAGHAEHGGGFSSLSAWAKAPITLLVIAAIIVGGRYVLRPVFRLIASTGIRELFTATALLVVVGIAVAMMAIDLSPALGTFIAGVVLADSEYRHELESDLDPFKGLLLGLFFITVGAQINFALLAASPGSIIGLVLALMVGKAVLIFGLARAWGIAKPHQWTMALALAQGGEFAFVLLTVIMGQKLIDPETARYVTLIVALSMALTPLLFVLNDKVIQPRFQGSEGEREADDPSAGHGKPVVIAGFGRYGQLAGRMLKANGFSASILDLDPNSIDTLRKHGLEVYYGDAARHDLLETAGCGAAKALIVAVDDPDHGLLITELAHKHFPDLKIIARAQSARYAKALQEHGACATVCEAEAGGLGLGEEALKALGFGAWRASRARRKFSKHQAETHRQLFESWGDAEATLHIHRQRVDDLDVLLDWDDQEQVDEVDKAWRTGVMVETLRDAK